MFFVLLVQGTYIHGTPPPSLFPRSSDLPASWSRYSLSSHLPVLILLILLKPIRHSGDSSLQSPYKQRKNSARLASSTHGGVFSSHQSPCFNGSGLRKGFHQDGLLRRRSLSSLLLPSQPRQRRNWLVVDDSVHWNEPSPSRRFKRDSPAFSRIVLLNFHPSPAPSSAWLAVLLSAGLEVGAGAS
jgi:hypothetical protein